MYASIRCKVIGDRGATRYARYREQEAARHVRELRMRDRLARLGMAGRQIGRTLARARGLGLRPIESGIAVAMNAVSNGRVPQDLVVAPEPEWISEAEAQRWNLWDLRANQMRIEARATYAAYAFLRGDPFESVEGKSYSPPPFDRVATIVAQYSEEDPRVALQRLAEWIDAAGWTKREVMRNTGHGVRTSAGMFWRHKDADHESYTHKQEGTEQ